MFSFFGRDNSKAVGFSMPSFLNTSWMNPFKDSLSNIKRVALTGGLLLQYASQAASESISTFHQCFSSEMNHYGLAEPQDNAGRKILYLLQDQCHVILSNCSEMVGGGRDNYFQAFREYGRGAIAGYNCELGYDTTPPNTCIDDLLKANCPDGFGSTLDILVVVFSSMGAVIAVGGTAMAVISAYNKYRYRHSGNAHAHQPLLRMEAANPVMLDIVPDKWANLKIKLEKLAEDETNQDAKRLLEAFKKTEQEYHCAITQVVINVPGKLPCEHHFEKNALLQLINSEEAMGHKAKCPCCRNDIVTSDVTTNELLQAAIKMKYCYFEKEINELERIEKQPFYSERSSSSFYSARSTSPLLPEAQDERATYSRGG